MGWVQEPLRWRGRLLGPRQRAGHRPAHLLRGLDTITLGAGESVTVDTGHVVAFISTVGSQIRKVTGGMVQTLKSGEGFVFDFNGPGWVMTQNRNPSALQAWIREIMPDQTGGASGTLGVLLGR